MKINRALAIVFLASAIVTCFPTSAQAGTLAAFNNSNPGPACVGGTSTAAASFVDLAVTTTGWTLTRTSGGCGDASNFTGLTSTPGNATYTFGLTATTSLNLTGFSFHESNNDCENNGIPFCSSGAAWKVDKSINGGTPLLVGTFSSGAPYTDYLFTYTLTDALSAGDSITFSILNTSGPVVSTANYGFYTGEIDGNSPEPATFVLLGSALVLVTQIRKRIVRN